MKNMMNSSDVLSCTWKSTSIPEHSLTSSIIDSAFCSPLKKSFSCNNIYDAICSIPRQSITNYHSTHFEKKKTERSLELKRHSASVSFIDKLMGTINFSQKINGSLNLLDSESLGVINELLTDSPPSWEHLICEDHRQKTPLTEFSSKIHENKCIKKVQNLFISYCDDEASSLFSKNSGSPTLDGQITPLLASTPKHNFFVMTSNHENIFSPKHILRVECAKKQNTLENETFINIDHENLECLEENLKCNTYTQETDDNLNATFDFKSAYKGYEDFKCLPACQNTVNKIVTNIAEDKLNAVVALEKNVYCRDFQESQNSETNNSLSLLISSKLNKTQVLEERNFPIQCAALNSTLTIKKLLEEDFNRSNNSVISTESNLSTLPNSDLNNGVIEGKCNQPCADLNTTVVVSKIRDCSNMSLSGKCDQPCADLNATVLVSKIGDHSNVPMRGKCAQPCADLNATVPVSRIVDLSNEPMEDNSAPPCSDLNVTVSRVVDLSNEPHVDLNATVLLSKIMGKANKGSVSRCSLYSNTTINSGLKDNAHRRFSLSSRNQYQQSLCVKDSLTVTKKGPSQISHVNKLKYSNSAAVCATRSLSTEGFGQVKKSLSQKSVKSKFDFSNNNIKSKNTLKIQSSNVICSENIPLGTKVLEKYSNSSSIHNAVSTTSDSKSSVQLQKMFASNQENKCIKSKGHQSSKNLCYSKERKVQEPEFTEIEKVQDSLKVSKLPNSRLPTQCNNIRKSILPPGVLKNVRTNSSQPFVAAVANEKKIKEPELCKGLRQKNPRKVVPEKRFQAPAKSCLKKESAIGFTALKSKQSISVRCKENLEPVVDQKNTSTGKISAGSKCIKMISQIPKPKRRF